MRVGNPRQHFPPSQPCTHASQRSPHVPPTVRRLVLLASFALVGTGRAVYRTGEELIDLPETLPDPDCWEWGIDFCQPLCEEDEHGTLVNCDDRDNDDDDEVEYDENCLAFCSSNYDRCEDGIEYGYDLCIDYAQAQCDYEIEHGSGSCDIWAMYADCYDDYAADREECNAELGSCEDTCKL